MHDDAFWKELGLNPQETGEETPCPEDGIPEEPEQKKKSPTVVGVIALTALQTVLVVLCLAVSLFFLGHVALMSGSGGISANAGASSVTILDKYDMYMTNQISSALDGVLSIKKVYWLSDSDLVAPKPDATRYGTVSTPAEAMWVLEASADLIGGQDMLFDENTPIWDREGVHYYYDDTILVLTWKQVIDRVMYTISEVKIAHPSQFRRFLADGEFGSDKLYVTTEMAQSVNAVLATSGDYYRFRHNGAVVYEGQLRRFEGEKVDTCFINDDGDLLFAYRGDLTSEAQAKKFVEENNVRFSMAFGPILVDEGEVKVPKSYLLGEINDQYSRAGLAQMDELHYLVVSAGGEGGNENRHTVMQFAENIRSFGAKKAYALDGGQTTVVAMDGKLINNVDFGFQRQISDIIYFATANPEVK